MKKFDEIEREVSAFLENAGTRMTQWCVVTGAPSSGKTSLITELANEGYRFSRDISREYIESQIESGISKYEVRESEEVLQHRIFLLMMKEAMQLPCVEVIFHDYALPDNIAFMKMAGIRVDRKVLRSAEVFRYDKVFLLERLKVDEDHVRTEDEKFQKVITIALRQVYTEIGYDIIDVPAISVEDRLKLVLSVLRNRG